MKQSTVTIFLIALLIVAHAAGALQFVRISDLQYSPTPPNPIKIAGTVTAADPVRLSDGMAEIELSGIAAGVGDFLIVEGNWDGHALQISKTFVGPARTEMVYVAAGAFSMGNNGGEPDSQADEAPMHTVFLSGYLIGKNEVTRAEYRAFIADGGYSNPAFWSTDGWMWKLANPDRVNPYYWSSVQNWGDYASLAFTQTEQHPVVGAMFYEADAFCRWAGGRLPSEAQWEKAARWNPITGQTTADLGDCNDYGDSGAGLWCTEAVGSHPASVSAYGCQDMAGNLNEWCGDYYSASYYSETPAGGWNNPEGPVSGSTKVIRGGAWDSDHTGCRPARRYSADPSDIWKYHWMTYGFRCAKDVPATATNNIRVTVERGVEAGTWNFTIWNDSSGLIPVELELDWGEIPSSYAYAEGVIGSPASWNVDDAKKDIHPSWQWDSDSGQPLGAGARLSGFTVKCEARPTGFTLHLQDSNGTAQPDRTGGVALFIH